MTRASDSAPRLSCKVALLTLLGCLNACGSARPQTRAEPARVNRPALRIGDPSPVTITASRDFTFDPSDDSLAEMCQAAATRAPLYYTSAGDPRAFREAVGRRVREFERWASLLERTRKVNRPEKVTRLFERHGTVLGHVLSAEAFGRLRESPRRALVEAFSVMARGGADAFILAERSPTERAFSGDKVIVRVESAAKAAELEVPLGQLEEQRNVRANLMKLAATPPPSGASGAHQPLSEAVRGDLAEIAMSGMPTLTFDEGRSRAARRAAVEQAKKTRMTFAMGQVILAKGETITLLHRDVLATMRSVRCEPCSGGLAKCAPGKKRLLKVGSISYTPIIALRSFRAAAGGEVGSANDGLSEELLQRVFVCDERTGRARARALKRAFDRVRPDDRERWQKLRDELQRELQVEVVLPLLQSFDGVPRDKLRAAIVEVYRRAQLTPLVATKPVPRSGEACVVRRVKKTVGEESLADCPVVPLARYRLRLAETLAQDPGSLVTLPERAQKASVELVQQLLVANTVFDAAETARRANGAAKAAEPARLTVAREERPKDRLIREGETLVPAGKRMTADDIQLLEQMYAVRCAKQVRAADDELKLAETSH